MSKQNLMTYLETSMKVDGCDLEASVRDTITDLMHICTIHDIDFNDRLESAKEVYEQETSLGSDITKSLKELYSKGM